MCHKSLCGLLSSQESPTCNLHFYPRGHICVRVCQRGLRHSHEPTGAAGLQCCGSGEKTHNDSILTVCVFVHVEKACSQNLIIVCNHFKMRKLCCQPAIYILCIVAHCLYHLIFSPFALHFEMISYLIMCFELCTCFLLLLFYLSTPNISPRHLERNCQE